MKWSKGVKEHQVAPTQTIYISRHNLGAQEVLKEVGMSVSDDPEQMSTCAHFLLCLDARTWTSGAESTALAEEVSTAMQQGMSIVLAHEMPCLGQGPYAVPFDSFFACPDGATPRPPPS